MSDTKYLSCAETAKLLRQALKESFAGVKFGVRSKTYAGGASITVEWRDGPTGAMVKAITDTFEGAYFDGMIDYMGSRYHSLDGQPVSFGANFIFTEHRFSKERAEAIVAHFAGVWGRSDWLSVEGGEHWGYRAAVSHSAPAVADEVARYEAATCGIEPKESATLARVKFTGDDGYGANTVGRDGTGRETAQGYPR